MLARKQTTEIGGQRWKFIEVYLASVPRPVHRPTNNNIRCAELVANKIIRFSARLLQYRKSRMNFFVVLFNDGWNTSFLRVQRSMLKITPEPSFYL